MPLYQYRCSACGHTLEEIQRFADPPLVTCPKCKQEKLEKQLAQTAPPVFKGSGFYSTDYGGKKPK
jgi:putative FmdB family regulatory protein